jgi:hypothetical protein
MSYWDFHKIPGGMTQGILNGPKQVYWALACFAVPAAMGAWALAGRLTRAHGIVSTVFFLAALAPEGVRKGLTGMEGVSTAIGGKLLFLAALVGLVGAVIAIAKPEQK